MTIEIRNGALRHRCTDCGTKWYPDRPAVWLICSSPEEHPCPKCSAKQPSEPEPCNGQHSMATAPTFWHYCPRCGVPLTEAQGRATKTKRQMCEMIRLPEGVFCPNLATHTLYERRHSIGTYACCRCFDSWHHLTSHSLCAAPLPVASDVSPSDPSPSIQEV